METLSALAAICAGNSPGMVLETISTVFKKVISEVTFVNLWWWLREDKQ